MTRSLARRLVAGAALAALAAAASAETLLTETFDGGTPSNSAYPVGTIPGTGVELLVGSAWITNEGGAHGPVLDLGSGWYTPNYDGTANVGSSTARSLASFDLVAGTTYTIGFDYSRQGWSAGNGPFETSLTVALGSHSVTYAEVAGFYYGIEWKPGLLSFTADADESGVHLLITASGPGGYSGMLIDNISAVGLAPVPEPRGAALLGAGMLALGWLARRRRGA